MEYGGPVWHVSTATTGAQLSEQFLRECALEELRGVGNAALGQWEEWSGRAYHIRRRLSREEQKSVGDPLDIRNTPEALKRCAQVQQYLPLEWRGKCE